MTDTQDPPRTRKIGFAETVLRDANQSLLATRMPFSDFEPILGMIGSAGYHAVECWGGATFDSCMRYLNEDPWERLRMFKAKVRGPKLQMLLRGQNLLGYKHYADDVVRMFVRLSVRNGIDVIRIFDALNDMRNIRVAVEETIACGAHAQGAISYTTSPIHNLGSFVAIGVEMKAMGAQSICVKDMAGIMGPQEAYDIVSALKREVGLPVQLHTHSTTGLGPLTLIKAVEAGCDVIDTAISALSGGTSQPATETLDYALRQLGYETGLDGKALKGINDYFKPIKDRYLRSGELSSLVMGTETDALIYQVPGGMLSNLVAQLKSLNALDRFEEVLAEIPGVRKDLGYPPLVTPMSQMVGVQATNNVLSGERYKNVTKEIKSYIKGEYGAPPGEVDAALAGKVLGGAEPIRCRFADTLEPEFAKAKAELGPVAESDEDVVSYILFPQIAERFFKDREERKTLKVGYSIRKVGD